MNCVRLRHPTDGCTTVMSDSSARCTDVLATPVFPHRESSLSLSMAILGSLEAEYGQTTLEQCFMCLSMFCGEHLFLGKVVALNLSECI